MPDIISLLSSGIIGGFLGAFMGGFAKFFWENWLPGQLTWRREQKVEMEKVLSQFRNPAIMATSDLQGRIFVLLTGSNYKYLQQIGMGDYYILSTAFLIAQFFAWVELLLQRMSMLDYSELTGRLEKATEGFSHGTPGFQIFRLEQREIGQRMINTSSNSSFHCMGYAEFVDMMKNNNVSSCFTRLETITKKLLEHPVNEMARLTAIQHALIELIEFLDPKAAWVREDMRTKFDLVNYLVENRHQVGAKTYNKIISDLDWFDELGDNQAKALEPKH